MVQDGQAPGSARLQLAGGTLLLRPEEQVLAAMLDGWRVQQLARNLAFSTTTKRLAAIAAFTRHADAFPWAWTAQMLDEWLGDLRAVRGLRRSTIRSYALAISAFCRYLTDPAYGWAAECEMRFGTYPVQVCHEWNTAVHVQQAEGDPLKRAFTVDELQAFFDHADEQVRRVRGRGRKGWLPVFRDAALFKVAYGFGLRRTEAQMLDLADLGTNPHAAEFGEYGLCRVRFGKAGGITAQAAQRADRLAVAARGAGAVDRRSPPAVRRGGGLAGVMALRTRAAGRGQRAEQAVQPVPRRARPGRGAGLPLAAPLLCDPPARRRVGPAVRPASGRPRIRLHHSAL